MQVSNLRSFTQGLISGILMIIILLLFRFSFRTSFLPETIAEKIFATVPGELESIAVLILGEYAKYSTLILTTVFIIVIYSVYPIIYSKIGINKIFLDNTSSFIIFSLLPVPFHLVLTILLGSRLDVSLLFTFSLIVTHFIYGSMFKILSSLYKTDLEGDQNEDKKIKRRIFLKKVAPAAVGIAILIYGIDRFLLPLLSSSRIENENLEDLYEKEVTPTVEFYRTDIALIPPSPNTSDWRLTLNGEVEQNITLDYEQFLSLPSVKEYVTLECISNSVGGPLIGSALWEGVKLSTIIDLAKPKSKARYVIFYCEDSYSVAIPLDIALSEGTILAYKMNNEQLNNIHGFPIRAIVPGIYGMMNAKWIRRIELSSEEYLGYWQSRGWSNTAEIETTSVIRFPHDADKITGTTPIAGIAFAGNRGVSKVEVSLDEGENWIDALLKDPLSDYTWLIWSIEWIPKNDGPKRIMVRATDKNNNVQTSEIRATYPDGATGLHAIDVLVERDTNR